MSRNEWERGTLTIPAAAWKPLRDGLAKGFNELQDLRLKTLTEVHAFVKAEKAKAKRGSYNFRAAVNDLDKTNPSLYRRLEKAEIEYNIAKYLIASDKDVLLMPKKKDLPYAVATKTVSYSVDGGSIHLTLDARQVHWGVSENNHAVDHARESYMAGVFFKLLAQVTWTRGSGGNFIGNDEYNQENESEGGGGNYVTARFGPKEKTTTPALYPATFWRRVIRWASLVAHRLHGLCQFDCKKPKSL